MAMAVSTFSRRDFIKAAGAAGAALGAAGAGAALADEAQPAAGAPEGAGAPAGGAPGAGGDADASLAADSLPDTFEADGATFTRVAASTYSGASWRVKPEDIPADQIAETYEADVCVMGLGHAGGTAAVELAEEGYSVVALEKQARDAFRTTGHDCGHINSELSASLGGGSGYDPVEFYTNWMLNCANDANPGLVMKYAKGGATVDWWYGKAAGDDARLVFAPADEERPNIRTENGPFKFYCSTVNFDDGPAILNGADEAEASNPASHFLFGYAGVRLLTDEDGKVTGVVAQNLETEEYIQVNCKAVVLATGGFEGDPDMAADLLPDMMYALQENDSFDTMGRMMGTYRTGDGIKMAYWLGARLEDDPATMDGRASWQNGSPALVPMLAQPQGIHLDYTGRRFYNEFWGPIESRSKTLFSRSRKLFYAVYDDDLTTDLEYVPASHGTYNPTAENIQKVRDVLDAAYAVKGSGYHDDASNSTWYAGDTIEECVAALGVDEKVGANIEASVESWNACVAAGSDTEFGRDAAYLFPIEKGPFYIEVNEDNVTLGTFLVTLGALRVDADQRVLGQDWKPIEGLFASGNTTGGRFGWDYFSPCYGVSVGMATILGRECGKSVGEYLEGKLV